MLSREIKDINQFIDTRLYAFPYDGNMKEMLTEEETKTIDDFAEKLKNLFKYINENLDKEQRRKIEFTSKEIKKRFNSIMMAFYGERFFEILEKLRDKCTHEGKQMIDEFYFHKQNQYTQDISNAQRYKKELKEIISQIKIKNKRN